MSVGVMGCLWDTGGTALEPWESQRVSTTVPSAVQESEMERNKLLP